MSTTFFRTRPALSVQEHVIELDEALALALLAGAEGVTNIALRIIKGFENPIAIGSLQHPIGVGIGVALVPRDGGDNVEILRKADIALYRAKSERKSAFCFFEQEMDERIRERDLLERELRTAIAMGMLHSKRAGSAGFGKSVDGTGHGLGLTVTAEGVEQPGQADALLAQGCEQAQGFLYGQAMTAANSLDFIAGYAAQSRQIPSNRSLEDRRLRSIRPACGILGSTARRG